MRPLIELALFTEQVAGVSQLLEAVTGEESTFQNETISVFELQGVTLLVHQSADASEAGPANEDHVAFATSDLDRTYEELVERGFDFELPPKDYEWGRSAYLRDPDGRMFELHEVTED